MTYIFDNIEDFTDEEYFKEIKYVSEKRAEKSMRYRFMIDKKISLIAYLLLVYAVKKEYGIDKMPEMLTDKLGKPYFKDSNLSFNLSHTRKGVMCSIYSNRVGCDIESIIQHPILVQSIFSLKERNIISNDMKYFTKLWTLKEAYSKCMGFGLTQKLNAIDFSEYIQEESFEIMEKKFLSGNKGDLYYSVCIDSVQENIHPICFLKKKELLIRRFENGRE